MDVENLSWMKHIIGVQLYPQTHERKHPRISQPQKIWSLPSIFPGVPKRAGHRATKTEPARNGWCDIFARPWKWLIKPVTFSPVRNFSSVSLAITFFWGVGNGGQMGGRYLCGVNRQFLQGFGWGGTKYSRRVYFYIYMYIHIYQHAWKVLVGPLNAARFPIKGDSDNAFLFMLDLPR